MPRRYVVSFESVSVSAAQDLLQIKGASGKMLSVIRLWVGNTNTVLTTNQQISLRTRYLPTTVTDGSGGSTSTPRPFDPGDAAASFTCLTNNTVKATTNATAATLDENGVNVYAGLDLTFSRPPQIGPSESLVFELLSTVAAALTLSGGAWVEEAGG